MSDSEKKLADWEYPILDLLIACNPYIACGILYEAKHEQ